MECDRIEELLSPYLEDELSPKDRQSVEQHLNSCTDCADLLSFLRDTNEALTAFPEVEISENLKNRLYEIPVEKKKFVLNLDFLLRPSLQPVLAVATILLMLISFYLFHPDRSIINRTIDREIHKGYSKIGQLYTKAESFAVSLFDQKDTLLDSLKNSKLFSGKEE
ncbi:MAG: zf-HC2 domain-containing protein [Candidatus Aminicenantes bacterium]|jgi:predicted anti-sigma-YlaC factor YlaD